MVPGAPALGFGHSHLQIRQHKLNSKKVNYKVRILTKETRNKFALISANIAIIMQEEKYCVCV